MKILVIAGSARRGSLNTRLAQVVAAVRPEDTVTLMNDLDRVPFYNGDVEAAGVPAAVRELREAVAEADALVMVTPEYNGTVPGMLGNAVDWLSRPRASPCYRESPWSCCRRHPADTAGSAPPSTSGRCWATSVPTSRRSV